MGQSVYPGLGPTNADIATAVAAPSAATIAAAVAAPSAATIATAVAAPSSSTIATAVAAAVPTLSQINTSVSTYAPSSNNWTVVATATPNNTVNTYTFSGLSGYKLYKVVYYITMSAIDRVGLRINGDAGSNYTYAYSNISSGGASGDVISGGTLYGINASGSPAIGYYLINNATIGAYKDIQFNSGTGGVSARNGFGTGVWQNTATITSITVLSSSNNFTAGHIALLGAN